MTSLGRSRDALARMLHAWCSGTAQRINKEEILLGANASMDCKQETLGTAALQGLRRDYANAQSIPHQALHAEAMLLTGLQPRKPASARRKLLKRTSRSLHGRMP